MQVIVYIEKKATLAKIFNLPVIGKSLEIFLESGGTLYLPQITRSCFLSDTVICVYFGEHNYTIELVDNLMNQAV